MTELSSQNLQILRDVASLADASDTPLFVVGGIVRDLLMQQPFGDYDLDFLVEGNGIAFAEEAYKHFGGTLKTFKRFKTAKVLFEDARGESRELDFATSRTETYSHPGALPEVKPASLKEDLRRRDFTINAMALKVDNLLAYLQQERSQSWLRRNIVDLFGGLADLESRRVRVLHEGSFDDDPSRMYRAFRYAVRLKGTLEEQTLKKLRAGVASGRLGDISLQRIWNELRKCLMEKNRAALFALLTEHGLLDTPGCFAPRDREELLLALGRLDRAARCCSAETIQEAGSILIFLSSGNSDQKVWVSLVGGKKVFASWRALGSTGRSPAHEELSDAALIALAALGSFGTREEQVLAELTSRGIDLKQARLQDVGPAV